MFDTHCHLDLPHFDDDRVDVIQRARDAGFDYFMIPGIEFATIGAIRELAESNPDIYFASGIHPNNAAELPDDWDQRVKQDADHPKCKAIGEIGMDYYWEDCPHDVQKRVFRRQLEIAGELGLPVIVHCRDAYEDMRPIFFDWMRSDRGHKAVLHAFAGNAEEGLEAVSLGIRLGIGGPYTFRKKNEKQLEVLRSIPLEAMLLETDCPYLAPHPFRGKRNEPAFAMYTLQKIAEVKGISFEEADAVITENGKKFFGIE